MHRASRFIRRVVGCLRAQKQDKKIGEGGTIVEIG